MRLYVNDNEIETLKKALLQYQPLLVEEADKRENMYYRVLKCEEMRTNHKVTIIIE